MLSLLAFEDFANAQNFGPFCGLEKFVLVKGKTLNKDHLTVTDKRHQLILILVFGRIRWTEMR